MTQLISIAYADDHCMMRSAMKDLIDSFGPYLVEYEANNGQDLIEILDKAKKLPDICILDISMPKLNGYETASIIKQKWPEMKIMALTMLGSDESIIKMLVHGAEGYVLKSQEPKELEHALESMSANGFYHSDLVSSQLLHAVKNKQLIIPKITEKEKQLLIHCCSELTYAQIAKIMMTSNRSVEGYRDSLFQKLKVNSRVSLALYAIKLGIVELT